MILPKKKPKHPLDTALALLSKKSLDYKEVMDMYDELLKLDIDLDLELLAFFGLDLRLDEKNHLSLKSRFTPIKDQNFCVVDIESTGSPSCGELLEIGAVKIKNKKIIASFESLIKVDNIPIAIEELTGINQAMVANSPSRDSVLNEFRLFLGTDIFVAHNVKTDFKYLDLSFEKANLGPLLNQRLCTFELAKKLILAPKHGLAFLKEALAIKSDHHRALSDAKASAFILIHCLKLLNPRIKTTQELLDFCNNS